MNGTLPRNEWKGVIYIMLLIGTLDGGWVAARPKFADRIRFPYRFPRCVCFFDIDLVTLAYSAFPIFERSRLTNNRSYK